MKINLKDPRSLMLLFAALLPFITATLYMSFTPAPVRLSRTHGGPEGTLPDRLQGAVPSSKGASKPAANPPKAPAEASKKAPASDKKETP